MMFLWSIRPTCSKQLSRKLQALDILPQHKEYRDKDTRPAIHLDLIEYLYNNLEFIPEEEWSGKGEVASSSPSTLLFGELEAGRRYELVVTNFYGMPFLRYRLGDIIKVVTPHSDKAGGSLPQVLFDSRVSDIINGGGSREISEKKEWQALLSAGLQY